MIETIKTTTGTNKLNQQFTEISCFWSILNEHTVYNNPT